MSDFETILLRYEQQNLFTQHLKPKLLSFISSLSVKESEDLEVAYLESLVNESDSYSQLCLMIDDMPNVVGHNITATKVGCAIRNEIEKYESVFAS